MTTSAVDAPSAPVITFEREEPTAWTPERIEVLVRWTTGTTSSVTVEGPRNAFGTLRPPQVNWSAIGAVSAEEATTYATAILVAAQMAATLRPATGVEEEPWVSEAEA